MRGSGTGRPRTEVVLILFIVILSIFLAAAAFEYSNSVSDNIQASAVAATETNTQIQSNDMTHILVNELASIDSNLQTLASSDAVQSGNATEAVALFKGAVNSTGALTQTYFWIDSHGAFVLSRNATGAVLTPPGTNLTTRPYFIGAKQSGTVYYSGLITNVLNQPVMDIALPIYSTNGSRSFEGVVGASIYPNAIRTFLESQIAPQLKSGIGLLDSKGIVLFSDNSSLVGQSIFGSAIQSLLPVSLRSTFNAFINSSLLGTAGFGELSYQGTSATIAYQPVLIPALRAQSAPVEFGVIYVSAPNVLAASQASQIGQLRLLTFGIIVAIGGICVLSAAIILRWNRRLEQAVKQRTFDLVLTNQQLKDKSEELARANLEIASQAESQRELFNITAHELRTPTQSILANAELMHDALQPVMDTSGNTTSQTSPSGLPSGLGAGQPVYSDAELSKLASSTYRNAQRLQKLIQNILNVVRIENKSLRLETEPVDMNEKIKNVIIDTHSIVEPNGLYYSDYNVVFDPEVAHLTVLADRTKVYEVLSNLIRNAVTNSPPGSTIRVTARANGDFAEVSVIDEGTGISPDVMPRLFTKFATTKGTGLGLFISKSYVEAHGGKIWAENNPDGKGATFSFTLPLDPSAKENEQNRP
jgi:signal transduction histidine kinase